ncbi:hypothetical protein Syun_007305 [Stephania yunnanensis]|uniref:Uncharacterized protein n=1 Tax=Stephania yunnanensis TaxID=152371 RepID=A0AAP0L1R7_9MAGN
MWIFAKRGPAIVTTWETIPAFFQYFNGTVGLNDSVKFGKVSLFLDAPAPDVPVISYILTYKSKKKNESKQDQFLITVYLQLLEDNVCARQLQNRRLWTYAVSFSCVAGFIVVVLSSFEEQLVLYITPTEALDKFAENPNKSRFRLGGLVLKASVARPASSPFMEFVVTDLITDILVRYKDPLPNLFRKGHSVVVEGFVRPLEDPDKEAAAAVTEKAMGNGCFFSATEVLAKHDEKYMPAEVAKAIDANKKKIAAAASAAEAQYEERERNQRRQDVKLDLDSITVIEDVLNSSVSDDPRSTTCSNSFGSTEPNPVKTKFKDHPRPLPWDEAEIILCFVLLIFLKCLGAGELTASPPLYFPSSLTSLFTRGLFLINELENAGVTSVGHACWACTCACPFNAPQDHFEYPPLFVCGLLVEGVRRWQRLKDQSTLRKSTSHALFVMPAVCLVWNGASHILTIEAGATLSGCHKSSGHTGFGKDSFKRRAFTTHLFQSFAATLAITNSSFASAALGSIEFDSIKFIACFLLDICMIYDRKHFVTVVADQAKRRLVTTSEPAEDCYDPLLLVIRTIKLTVGDIINDNHRLLIRIIKLTVGGIINVDADQPSSRPGKEKIGDYL